jgi:hypothetical protein
VSKKLLMLVGICLSVSACNNFPPMPDIEVKLVDKRNQKIHYYLLPKQQGEDAKYLRSVPLTFDNLQKNFAIDPRNYSILEGYMTKVEDYAKERCK